MYMDQDAFRAKIGKINVAPRGNSIRIRFFYPAGQAREFTVATKTSEGFLKAVTIAQQINRDIEMGQFDETLATYSPRHAKAIAITNKPLNLKELWENYKTYNKDRVAKTTINNKWSVLDRILDKSDFLELDIANDFVKEQLEFYSLTTLSGVWSNCLNPAVNFAIKQKKITIENPYILPTLKQVENDIDCYEKDEIYAILDAFKNNTYCPTKSAYTHDYYWHYTYFQSLTGARPENTVALQWDDVITKSGRTYIRFNKAYSRGVLLPYTKNKTIIMFPVNKQLEELLNSIVRTKNPLIFPSVKGKYFNASNYSRRIWKRIIRGLINDEVLDRYLPPYNLRHSFITRLVREGIDVKTIAALSGNSVEIIIERYLKTNQSIDIPPL